MNRRGFLGMLGGVGGILGIGTSDAAQPTPVPVTPLEYLPNGEVFATDWQWEVVEARDVVFRRDGAIRVEAGGMLKLRSATYALPR